ncbi:MAG: hypothetical protein NVSMB25_13880 [Thermoleophilaceae bacterium]
MPADPGWSRPSGTPIWYARALVSAAGSPEIRLTGYANGRCADGAVVDEATLAPDSLVEADRLLRVRAWADTEQVIRAR